MVAFFVGLIVGFLITAVSCAYGNDEINMEYYYRGREDAFREMGWDDMEK